MRGSVAIHLLLLFQMSVAGTLTSNVTGGLSCPDDMITFTCTQDPPDSTALQWSIIGSGTAGDIGGIDFLFSRVQAPLVVSISSSLVDGTAALLSTSPTVESTLTLTVTAQLDGARVECSGATTDLESEVINIASRVPSPPQNVMVTVVENGTTNVTVSITWDNGGAAVDGYTVQTSPSSATSVGTPPAGATSVRLVLSYNMSYNVTVTASNCAGSSSSVAGPVEFVGCPLPSNPNVTFEPYTSSAVGSVIYYKCSPGFIPEGRVMSVCGGDGRWDPDPDQYSCTEVDCGDPRLPENSTVIRGPSSGNRNGSEVTFQCNEGLFPSMEITIVCTSEERWQQDPEMIACTDQPVTCSRPSEPTNGFLGEVTSTTAEFGCDSDPQESMTAQCVATDTWNPDPAQEECSSVSTTDGSLSSSSSIAGAVAGVVVAVLFVMIVTVVISVVMVAFILRKKGNSTEKEDFSEGNDIKLEENQAYGHIKVPHHPQAPAHQPEPVYDQPFTGTQYRSLTSSRCRN